MDKNLYRKNSRCINQLRDRYYTSKRKAVASHFLHGDHNPNALSIHLTDEIPMPPEDRKNTQLPCGYTLSESWAALRKCWKGFEIAKSENNLEEMAKYAKRIRKLQREMGIQVTEFDIDISDDQDVNQIQPRSTCRYERVQQEKAKVARKVLDSCQYVRSKERSLDYDKLMDGQLKVTGSNTSGKPSPRPEIFSKARPRNEKSCAYKVSKNHTDKINPPN